MRTPPNKKTKQPCPNRSLKIQPHIKFRPAGFNRSIQTTVPVIRLSGVWLEKLGFNPYQRVSVITKKKLLIIRLDESL